MIWIAKIPERHYGRRTMRLVPILLLATASHLIAAEDFADCLGNCGKSHLLPLGNPVKPGRKYARDRLVDIQHLALEVTPDFKARSIKGTVTLTFTPIGLPLTKLELDAMDLQMEAITAKDCQLAGWQNTEEQLVLNFGQPLAVGATASVTIQYHCEPKNGFHFRTPELGYLPDDTQAWSQGEAEYHRYWFPCYDYPNERFTSEVTCHAPDGMDVISNGRLISKEKDAAGLNVWHWSQDKPHVNYLIALAAGYFHKIEDKAGEIPLAMYVPPSEKPQAELAFLDTKNIIEFYQKEIGVAFPWDKYSQVYCLDFLAGGMENTSCTFQGVAMLAPKEVGLLESSHRLDAHELAHQWFGDLLTCRDWSHLWLNEGFASYYTILFEEQKNGRDGMLIGLRNAAQRVLDTPDTRPIVWRDYGDAMQQFDNRAYPKGAWVLHMLRSQLGKELYQKGVRTYVERHRNGIVTTDDLQEILEEVSGKSLDRFFDQWVHHGGTPEIKADYSWDEKSKLAKVTLLQKQKVDEKVLLFELPVPIRFTMTVGGVVQTQEVVVKFDKAEEDFYFNLPAAPDIVRLDPELTILAKWDFKPSRVMLEKLLKTDFLSRSLAVEALGANKTDAEATALLVNVLATDPHFSVRADAAKALQTMGTDAARAGLIAQLNQPDERARRAAVDALSAFYVRDARDALVKLSETEQNPSVLGRIITGLQSWPDFDAAPFLNRASYHGMVMSSAVQTLETQNRQETLPAIMETVKKLEGQLPEVRLSAILDAVGSLSRSVKNSPAQPFLSTYLNHPNAKVRAAAAKALGEQADPRSIAALTGLSKRKQDQAAPLATAAIARINAQMSAPEQTQDAWQKVEKLQQKSEELEKKLEKLEGRLKPQ